MGVALVLRGYCVDVVWMLRRCCVGAAWVLRGCCVDVAWMLRGYCVGCVGAAWCSVPVDARESHGTACLPSLLPPFSPLPLLLHSFFLSFLVSFSFITFSSFLVASPLLLLLLLPPTTSIS